MLLFATIDEIENIALTPTTTYLCYLTEKDIIKSSFPSKYALCFANDGIVLNKNERLRNVTPVFECLID